MRRRVAGPPRFWTWIAALLLLACTAVVGAQEEDPSAENWVPAPEDSMVVPEDPPAAERITDYRSDIAVDRDGWLTVTETIAVVAAGESIKRGIYRDFRRAIPALGTRVQVP